MNLKKFFSRLRPSAPNIQFFLAMMEYGEHSLPRAFELGEISPEALEYCQGTIELVIQGKRVAKTRKQWADYLIGLTREGLGTCPFRSYDSKRTKAEKLRKAVLLLEPFNKVHPEATLEE